MRHIDRRLVAHHAGWDPSSAVLMLLTKSATSIQEPWDQQSHMHQRHVASRDPLFGWHHPRSLASSGPTLTSSSPRMSQGESMTILPGRSASPTASATPKGPRGRQGDCGAIIDGAAAPFALALGTSTCRWAHLSFAVSQHDETLSCPTNRQDLRAGQLGLCASGAPP